jgi:prophage regulatory protein
MTNLRIERGHALYGHNGRAGVSRSPFYAKVRAGLWTKPVLIGKRATGWPAHECDALLAAQIRGATDAEIRALVAQLHAARQQVA